MSVTGKVQVACVHGWIQGLPFVIQPRSDTVSQHASCTLALFSGRQKWNPPAVLSTQSPGGRIFSPQVSIKS